MRPAEGASLLSVRVKPGSANDMVLAVTTDPPALTIRVRAPARDGEANAAVVRLLAGTLGVAKTAVVLHRGAAARNKLYRIALPQADLRSRLNSLP